MNVDMNGIPHASPELIKHLMERSEVPAKAPTPRPSMKVPAQGSCLRKYKGSFTVEPQGMTSGRVETVHVTLEATNREEAIKRMRAFANEKNPGMNCARFQVSPIKPA